MVVSIDPYISSWSPDPCRILLPRSLGKAVMLIGKLSGIVFDRPRFIPFRTTGNLPGKLLNLATASSSQVAGFTKMPENTFVDGEKIKNRKLDEAQVCQKEVLETEIFHLDSPRSSHHHHHHQVEQSTNKSLLRYSSRDFKKISLLKDPAMFSSIPLSTRAKKIISQPRYNIRSIEKSSFRTLDAPEISNDFYTNILDWSCNNNIVVPLADKIYVWNDDTHQVSLFASLPETEVVTAAKWMQRGSHLAIASNLGNVAIWDLERAKKSRSLPRTTDRVDALAWNNELLSLGTVEGDIVHHDVRLKQSELARNTGHVEGICNLAWSADSVLLSSGSNDNSVMIWDRRKPAALFQFTGHCAAVKALTWSPHTRHLLATGGGKHDQSIRLWSASTGAALKRIKTRSQICGMAWASELNEIITAHGYDEHAVMLWNYPSMHRLAVLSGHQDRILHMCLSPGGNVLCTGGPDETLRFWNLLGSHRSTNHQHHQHKEPPLDSSKQLV